MATKKSSLTRLMEKHYQDMLGLNKLFIETMRGPRAASPIPPLVTPSHRKLTKKQLKALELGRKKLASGRRKTTQI